MKHNAQTTNPLVSVVMPVYNAEGYLEDSIESILNQTYKRLEFIIADDCSTDTSYKILRGYQRKYPKIIKLIRNKKNLKQALSVEKAIRMAKGSYIARMDADDIALPTRIEKQVKYLQKHKDTVAVGTQCLLINQNGHIIGEKKFPVRFEEIYKYIFEFCPAQQPTLMIAKDLLPKEFGYYDHGMAPVEDVEFLFKIFQYGKVENLSEYLHMYRIHGNNSSLRNFKKSFLLTLISRIKGVLYHSYKPTVKGVIVTVFQTLTVFLLPQAVTYGLYRIVKKLDSPKPARLLPEGQLALRISKAL